MSGIPTTGAVSMTDLNTEFNGSAAKPYTLGVYKGKVIYRTSDNVPQTIGNTSVSMSLFRGYRNLGPPGVPTGLAYSITYNADRTSAYFTMTWGAPVGGFAVDSYAYDLYNGTTTTTYTNITDLTASNAMVAGNKYRFAVKASNAAGFGSYSSYTPASGNEYTYPYPPGKPTASYSKSGSTFTMTWTAAAVSGSVGASSTFTYILYGIPGDGGGGPDAETSGSSGFTFSMISGYSYQFKVRAFNDNATSSAYSDLTPSPAYYYPNAPSVAAPSKPTASGNTITFTGPTPTVDTKATYTYFFYLRRSASSDMASPVVVGSSYTTPGTQTYAATSTGYYQVLVTVYNDNSSSVQISPVLTFTYTAGPTVTANTPTSSGNTISYSGTSTGETSYTITLYSIGTGTTATGGTVAASSTTTLSPTAYAATATGNFYTKVVAANAGGSTTSTSGVLIFTYTPAPNTPVSVGYSISGSTFRMNWTAPTGTTTYGTATMYYYIVYTNGVAGGVISTTNTGTPAATTTMTNGNSYQFKVKANNAGGDSSYSALTPTTAYTYYATPPTPTADNPTISGGSLIMSWTISDPSNLVTGYRVTPSANGVAQTAIIGTMSGKLTTLSSLTPGVEYSFTVSSTNNTASSTAASPANSVTYTPPSISGLSIAITNGIATFGWTVQNEESFTVSLRSYTTAVVYTTISSSDGTAIQYDNTYTATYNPSGNTNLFIDNNSYYISVTAVSTQATIILDNVGNRVTYNQPSWTPDATAISFGTGAITLLWTPVVPSGLTYSAVLFTASNNTQVADQSVVYVNNGANTTTTATFTATLSAVAYYVKLYVSDANITVMARQSGNVTPSVVGALSGFQAAIDINRSGASPITTTVSVILSWNTVTNAASYTVSNGGAGITTTNTTYTYTITPNTPTSYTVYAKNALGNGTTSTPLNITYYGQFGAGFNLWTKPSGVSQISFILTGAGGAGSLVASGGKGAIVTGTYTTSTNIVITTSKGGGTGTNSMGLISSGYGGGAGGTPNSGTTNWGGGGGGGAWLAALNTGGVFAANTASTALIAVAGGGGGAGSYNTGSSFSGSAGGNADADAPGTRGGVKGVTTATSGANPGAGGGGIQYAGGGGGGGLGPGNGGTGATTIATGGNGGGGGRSQVSAGVSNSSITVADSAKQGLGGSGGTTPTVGYDGFAIIYYGGVVFLNY